MAKKWKLGVKYQFKDKAGFLDACTLNHHIVELIGDSVFSIADFDYGKNFCKISLDGKELELPYEIAKDERKFFKVVKEKFVVGGQYVLIDRKGFIKAHAGNQEISELWDDENAHLITDIEAEYITVSIDGMEFYLTSKEIKFFKRVD